MRIEQITIEEDGFLTNDVLKQLIEGAFSVDLQPLYEAGIVDEDLEEPILLRKWIDFSIVLKEVSRYVRETTPVGLMSTYSEKFWKLRYFVERYVTEGALSLRAKIH